MKRSLLKGTIHLNYQLKNGFNSLLIGKNFEIEYSEGSNEFGIYIDLTENLKKSNETIDFYQDAIRLEEGIENLVNIEISIPGIIEKIKSHLLNSKGRYSEYKLVLKLNQVHTINVKPVFEKDRLLFQKL